MITKTIGVIITLLIGILSFLSHPNYFKAKNALLIKAIALTDRPTQSKMIWK